MANDFDKITKLADASKKAPTATIPVFDGTEGAGYETRKVTAKIFHDEMGSTYHGIKSHEVGIDNKHTGNHSLAYGIDLTTGIPPYDYTCSAGGLVLTIAGIDVTNDFRVGDAVVLIKNGVAYERIINGSVFGTDTEITIDSAVGNFTSGVILTHAFGNRVINIGINNHIKGDDGAYVGTGGRVDRDVAGFSASGFSHHIKHSGSRAAGYNGMTHWHGEDYVSAPMTASEGDCKVSRVFVKALTTDATVTKLTLANGTLLVLPVGTSAYFFLKANAVQTGGSAGTAGDSYACRIQGLIKNVAGTVTIIAQDTPFEESDVAFTGSLAVAVDATNDALSVQATGQANKNITWFAEVELILNIIA